MTLRTSKKLHRSTPNYHYSVSISPKSWTNNYFSVHTMIVFIYVIIILIKCIILPEFEWYKLKFLLEIASTIIHTFLY